MCARSRTLLETTELRSRIMSRIRGKDTGIEVFFRKALFHKGYRYRKNARNIQGHPDLFLRRFSTAIFLNGCFWHRHASCRLASHPRSNVDYWEAKFAANVSRDEATYSLLRAQGFKVLVVWECLVKQMMKDEKLRESVLEEVQEFLQQEEEKFLVLE